MNQYECLDCGCVFKSSAWPNYCPECVNEMGWGFNGVKAL